MSGALVAPVVVGKVPQAVPGSKQGPLRELFRRVFRAPSLAAAALVNLQEVVAIASTREVLLVRQEPPLTDPAPLLLPPSAARL